MTPEIAYKILKARDAIIECDIEETFHWLYAIASPNFDKMSDEVWKELEEMAKLYTPLPKV